MTAIISAADRAKLSRPHVARCWFGMFDFPDAVRYWHTGFGSKTIDGHTWLGVTDVLGGRLVKVDQVEEPRFGQATAVSITLSGASREFIQSTFETARDVEGRSATIYWAAFDQESEELITDLIPLFPRGKMTAPSIHWQGIGIRYVSLTIENIWAAQNFAPGGRWNPADQQRRFPGDLGLDFVGVKVGENWP